MTPNRPFKAHYTTAEDQYVRDNWGRFPVSQLARKLGRTVFSIYAKAEQLGLPKMTEILIPAPDMPPLRVDTVIQDLEPTPPASTIRSEPAFSHKRIIHAAKEVLGLLEDLPPEEIATVLDMVRYLLR